MVNSLDMNFINHALKITSFNLTSADFTKTTHKKEIQYLFNMHFFPKFDVTKTVDDINIDRLNSLIANLKREDMNMFKKLHGYNLKGVGPGEATLYFLINTAKLGGGSSAGVDIIVGSVGYEVKAVKVSNGIASDFKLGGTVPLSEVMTQLNDLRLKLGLGGSKTEMSGSITDMMRQKAPGEFNAIESRYAKLAAEYFKGHKVIFINNGTGPSIGNIEAIKYVQQSEIMIERVTSGTVKPKVKL